MEKYQNLIVTEDAIQNAKKTKADLNKFRTAIEDERKRIKNLCLEPYNAYELKIKELVGLIDKPINAIDTQIKNFEDDQKENKRLEIAKFYDENIGELNDLFSFVDIFNGKWLNSSVSMKSIKEEISQKLERIRLDLNVITGLKSEFEITIKDFYLNNFFDISKTLAENTRLQELKEKQTQKEEAKNIQPSAPVEVQTASQIVDKVQTLIKEYEPVTKALSMRVYVNKSQCEALNNFLTSQNIKFEQI